MELVQSWIYVAVPLYRKKHSSNVAANFSISVDDLALGEYEYLTGWFAGRDVLWGFMVLKCNETSEAFSPVSLCLQPFCVIK